MKKSYLRLALRLFLLTPLYSVVATASPENPQPVMHPSTHEHSEHFAYLSHQPELSQSTSITGPRPSNKIVHNKTVIQQNQGAIRISDAAANCSVAHAVSLSGDAQMDFIQSLPSNCIQYSAFWQLSSDTRAFYTQATMQRIVATIADRATSYDGTETHGLFQLLGVLRAGFFLQSTNRTQFDFDNKSEPLRTNLIDALKDVYNVNGLMTDTSFHTQFFMYEWLYLISNQFLQVSFFDELNTLLKDIRENRASNEKWLENVWNIYSVLGRVSFRDKAAMEALYLEEVDFFNQLRFWSMNMDILATADYVAYAPLYLLTQHLMGYESLEERAFAFFNDALDYYPKDSPWFLALIDGTGFKRQCEDIAPAYCKETYKSELLARAYPNTYTFDDGQFVVRTALDIARAEQLYNASRQVKAQFHRVTQNTQAVPGDNAETLTMFIAHSRQQYENLQQYLFNLDSDNGGIYIESDATFYTYERTEQDSIFSLEELFRHEYVHYLDGRYQIHGLWGTGELYSSPHSHWVSEGLAEFLAGSTQHDGIRMRANIVGRIGDSEASRMSLAATVNETFGFEVYNYAAMLHHFLYDRHPQTHLELLKAIQQNEISEYDNIIANIANDNTLNNEFQDYMDTRYQDQSQWWEASTDWIFSQQLVEGSLTQVRNSLADAFSVNFTCQDITPSVIRRFYCESNAPLSDTDAATLSQRLDTTLRNLLNDENPNAVSYTCHFGNLENRSNSVRAPIVCEGSLRATNADNSNQAPIINAEADFRLFDGAEASLTVFAFDPENQAMSYQWEQISGPTVEWLSNTNQQTVEFKAPFISQNTRAEFRVRVSDGDKSAVDNVVVQLLKLNNHAPLLDETIVYIDLNYGETAQHTVNATDSNDDTLRYRWTQFSDSDEDYIIDIPVIETKSFTFDSTMIPISELENFDYRIVNFEVEVSDSTSTSTQQVKFYVYSVDNETLIVNLERTITAYADELKILTVEVITANQEQPSIVWSQDAEISDYNLGLSDQEGTQISLDFSNIPDSAYQEGQVILVFDVTVTTSFRSKTLSTDITILKNREDEPDDVRDEDTEDESDDVRDEDTEDESDDVRDEDTEDESDDARDEDTEDESDEVRDEDTEDDATEEDEATEEDKAKEDDTTENDATENDATENDATEDDAAAAAGSLNWGWLMLTLVLLRRKKR